MQLFFFVVGSIIPKELMGKSRDSTKKLIENLESKEDLCRERVYH